MPTLLCYLTKIPAKEKSPVANIIGVIIPGSLALIMFGMGTGLAVSDFTRLFRQPKAVSVGLFCQIIMLPVVAWLLVKSFQITPVFAVGILLIALTPGGAVSNLFTLLAKGDLALSVTLTACSSLLAVFTIPFLLNLALINLMGEGQVIQLPVGKTMLQIALITVIPVTLGMIMNAQVPEFTRKFQGTVKGLSMLFLLAAVAGIVSRERANLVPLLVNAGPPAVLLNLVTMALGLLIGRLARLTPRQVITLAIEVGIQNAILATALAVAPQFLGRTDIGLVPTVYGFTMVVIMLIFIGLIKFAPGILGGHHKIDPTP